MGLFRFYLCSRIAAGDHGFRLLSINLLGSVRLRLALRFYRPLVESRLNKRNPRSSIFMTYTPRDYLSARKGGTKATERHSTIADNGNKGWLYERRRKNRGGRPTVAEIILKTQQMHFQPTARVHRRRIRIPFLDLNCVRATPGSSSFLPLHRRRQAEMNGEITGTKQFATRARCTSDAPAATMRFRRLSRGG